VDMKVLILCVCISIFVSAVSAQEIDESLIDKIKHISEGLLEGYSQPLITAFGTAMGTGLFHSAYSHDILGFDVGLRVMYINIPTSARYFSGTALACSLAYNDLVWYEIHVDSISTIFGPDEVTDIPTASGNAYTIPPFIPGGFDLSGVGFAMPQLNIGLPYGLEIAIRYIPFAITYPFTVEGVRGTDLYFLGVGGKLEITKLPFLATVPMPLAVAVGGFYQKAKIAEAGGYTSIHTSTWNVQLLVSKRLVIFEPLIGVGFEGTTVNFHYDFEYVIPDTSTGVPTDVIEQVSEINASFHSQSHYRAFLGFTVYMGPIFFHYDYNILPYTTHNGMVGITIR
jgi:hypothetical protein